MSVFCQSPLGTQKVADIGVVEQQSASMHSYYKDIVYGIRYDIGTLSLPLLLSAMCLI